ncbi:hypothetical protein QEN58_09020 [Halomonas alkaliantarctica]|uniref:Uncharacterized protein n=1 Tax=Halomonas alkaliantarctica TaxID=232346 RepID=A0ABY8LRY5_9GAMM|nr:MULTISPECIES: hypothetical protein [Halomonas]OJA04454.1 hypothetical protein QHL1GM_03085 [Halomonas sp. QHL1]WGI27190.1 hypothetical protein QEN58_09020 [Halomonas alkaliantarctica]
MSMINQLKDVKTKDFAKHCYESSSVDKLREASEGSADQAEMEHWGLTEGQWEEAIVAALADHEAKE